MTKFILAFLLFLSLAGGAFWYWTTTPQYSMMKLAEAFHNHDLNSFRNYFDIDSVSSHATDDLMKEELREVGGRGLLQRFIGITIAKIFKPDLGQALSNKIVDFVQNPPDKSQDGQNTNTQNSKTDGTATSSGDSGEIGQAVEGLLKNIATALKPPSLREVLDDIGVNKENFKGLTSFEVSGTLCHVGLKFQPPGKSELIVQLELENVDNHWKVIRFSNIDTVTKAVSGI